MVSLELAINAIRTNRREDGRQLLNLLIQQNPNNETAWLWMSEVVDTNERRARCLYHVLAINPGNNLARHGLQRLGITVTDSRPVKLPQMLNSTLANDSVEQEPTPSPQPVEQEPTPSPQPVEQEPAPLPQPIDQEANQLDPKTITKELPFTPVREPFVEVVSSEPEVDITIPKDNQRLQELTSLLEEDTDDSTLDEQPENATTSQHQTPPQPKSEPLPLPDFDAALAQSQAPSNTESHPIPVVFSYSHAVVPILTSQGDSQPVYGQPLPGYISPSPPTRPANIFGQALHPSQIVSQPQFQNGQNGQMFVQLTRPSYPVYAPHTTTMGMPPSTSIPVIHANTTMGMPYMYNPSNTTMGMPIQQPNGASPQFPSNQGMPPPSDQELIAAWQNGANQASQPSPKTSQKLQSDDNYEDEEEVNMVVVFIFGLLTITGLGGFGVLTILAATMY
jgi:hypothetical protein